MLVGRAPAEAGLRAMNWRLCFAEGLDNVLAVLAIYCKKMYGPDFLAS